MATALITVATGSVVGWGEEDLTGRAGAGQSVVTLQTGAAPPAGVPRKYLKVVAGLFVEMTAPEKAAVDLVFPVRKVLRASRAAELTATTGNADPGNGWVSAFSAPLQSPPLEAGEYQLSVSFELALLAAAAWNGSGAASGAQARLLMNGSEIGTWIWPFDTYTRQVGVFSAAQAAGAAPVFDFQIRRAGAAATARARKIVLTIKPIGSPDVDAT